MNRLVNELNALLELVIKRTRSSLGSYLSIALGVIIATTTICGLILYAEAVNVTVLRDQLSQAHDAATFDLLVNGGLNQVDRQKYHTLNDYINTQVQQQVGLPITRVGRHGWSKPLTLIPPGQEAQGQRVTLNRVRFQFYSNLKDLVVIVDGSYPQSAVNPSDVVEVMVTQKLADKLNLHVGQNFEMEDFTGAAQSVHIPVRLAGILRLKDEKAQAYLYAPWFLDEAFTITEDSFFNVVSLLVKPTQAEFVWADNYDEHAIDIDNVDSAINGFTQLDFALKDQLENVQLLTSMTSTLNDFKRNTFMLQALLAMLGAPVIAIALYYITMSADLLVEYQRSEIAVLKSRGSSTGQVLSLFLLQGLVLVLPAILLAPFLAIPVAGLIGKADTFMVFTNPRFLPITVRPMTFVYSGVVGLLALAAIFLPTLAAARQTVVTYRHTMAREKRTSLIHRYYIDVLLLVLGGLGYWKLSQNDTIITRNAAGGLQFDPLLVLTPIVLVTGSAFLILRLIPLLFRLFSRLSALTESVSGLFALRQIARTTSRYNGLILILTFTLALGLFTTAIANAFDRNYLDQAMYAAGADLRTREFDYKKVIWTVRPLEEYQSIPGVIAASPLKRVELVGRQAEILAKGFLLAVDLATIGQVAWWRSDFTPSLDEIVTNLNSNEEAVVANKQFINSHNLKIGQKFTIDADGKAVEFILAGIVGYFPTLYPSNDDQLIARLDYVQKATQSQASEVWLATRSAQHAQVITALKTSGGTDKGVWVYDGHLLTGVRKDDPLRTGLFGALSLGFVASCLLSILGFLLYAYMSIQSRSLQFGVLRATGLSVSQLVKALSSEQLSLIGIGVFVGTVLGGGAGWMFTRFLQISIIAREATPPFMVTVPWIAIAELYIILVVIFSVALAASVYMLRQMRIASVLRLGEQ